MVTIKTLIEKTEQAKNAIGNITVKGADNAELLAFAYRQCESVVKDLYDSLAEIQNEQGKEPPQSEDVVNE